MVSPATPASVCLATPVQAAKQTSMSVRQVRVSTVQRARTMSTLSPVSANLDSADYTARPTIMTALQGSLFNTTITLSTLISLCRLQAGPASLDN